MLILLTQLNLVAKAIILAIVVIFLSSLVISILVKNKYKVLVKDLTRKDNRENGMFLSPVINKIIEEFRIGIDKKTDEMNSIALIEKYNHLSQKGLIVGERFVKKSISLMIVLGLLGTFYGLTLSIGELVDLLSQTGASVVGDVASITDGLIDSIKAMSVAFITSLFGIGSSIVLTVLSIFLNVSDQRAAYMVTLEEYLDNSFSRSTPLEKDINDLEIKFTDIGEMLESKLGEAASTISYRLTGATAEMARTTEALTGSINKFETSINKFGENTRDFAEFNYHLRTNIQRMNVTFDDFATNIKDQNFKLEEVAEKIIANNNIE